jgi:hypothetical protein
VSVRLEHWRQIVARRLRSLIGGGQPHDTVFAERVT